MKDTISRMMYDFKGNHYLASLKDCGIDLKDISTIKAGVEAAIIHSGATILTYNDHTFEGGGYTIFFVLSESHCSIHTYPEYGHLFIDYFTCGDSCNVDVFHTEVTQLFRPRTNDFQIIQRM